MNMTQAEIEEWERLSHLWATRRATKKQIMRCMELDRKAAERPAKVTAWGSLGCIPIDNPHLETEGEWLDRALTFREESRRAS
jgi:Ser/Thr protein kinase RdoA (MazF antagonist)